MNDYLDLNYLKFSEELKDKIVNDADFCKSLAKCGTLESCRAYLDVLLDFYMESLSVCYKGSNTQALADAKILLQMMFVKGMNLRRMLEPLGYIAPRIRINPIIDQVSVNSMVRDIFELFCAFELVYILPDTDDKRLVLYDLFQLQGLRERQGYSAAMEEHKKKLELEKKEIADLENEIRQTEFYKSLNSENKHKMDEFYIKNSRFKIIIDSDNNMKKFDYGEDMTVFGIKEGVMDHIYSYLSENSHPSFLAVMQFRDAFNKNDMVYKQICATSSMQAISFMSMFLADFSRLFTEVVSLYKQKEDNIKRLLDYYNVKLRTSAYSFDPSIYSK